MIRFALHCAHDHDFEGWFRDGVAFERQAADGAISCPICGDSVVRKAMMAPAVVRSATRVTAPQQSDAVPTAPPPTPAAIPDQVKAAMMVAMLRQVRRHVEQNFENVGERFPEEARRMHYGEVEEREIFGRATPEEARDLQDEGIQVRALPDLPELDS